MTPSAPIPAFIETAGPAHASVLAVLQEDIFGAGATAWPASAWADWLGAPGVVALLASDREAGCGTAMPLGPLGLAMGRTLAGEAELMTIGVLPMARRRGVARALLDRLLADLAGLGATRLVLEVADDNGAALAFYARAGFQAVGRRPGYYTGADGAVDARILDLALMPPPAC